MNRYIRVRVRTRILNNVYTNTMKRNISIQRLAVASLCLLLTLCAVPANAARKQVVTISSDGKATLTVYMPERPTGRAIVCCPGGGYRNLSMDNEGHNWADFFNAQGITFCVLKYRMPQGDRTIPVGDAQKAIRTVRDSAIQWHVNPYDVGIMGFSAGGHLASTVSTHSELAVRPNFSILFYPVITMNLRDGHKGSTQNFLGEDVNSKELVREFSNQNAVCSHITPPAIILTANDDRTVPPVTNAIAYYSAMRRAGNDCALYVYPSGGHGFGFRQTWAYHEQMKADLTRWLQTLHSPQKDDIRVACIGNSITDGMGIDMRTRLGYPATLQHYLGKGYNVKNCGVSSRTMLNKGDYPYMREQAWRDALAFQPNIVVIKLGTNDSKPENWQYKADFKADMQEMVDSLRKLPSKPRILLCTPIPAFQPRWGITDSVITSEVIPAIRQVAKKNKLTVIDLHSIVTDPKLMTSDMIHPNDKGAALMAKTIAEVIKED